MSSFVKFEDFNFENIVVGNAKKNDLTDEAGARSGHWLYIELFYKYPGDKVGPIRILFSGLKTSGIRSKNIDNKESGKVKTVLGYQYPVNGYLEQDKIKFFKKIRKTIGEMVVSKHKGEHSHIKKFDPNSEKGYKDLYWSDENDEHKTRWYPQISPYTNLFIPSSKTKSKTSILMSKKITEDFERKIEFEIEQDLIWEIRYFYANKVLCSIINSVYQSLIYKIELKSSCFAEPSLAVKHLENPDIEDELNNNLKQIELDIEGETSSKKSKKFDKILEDSDNDEAED